LIPPFGGSSPPAPARQYRLRGFLDQKFEFRRKGGRVANLTLAPVMASVSPAVQAAVVGADRASKIGLDQYPRSLARPARLVFTF
jgi:hypothetical protein